MAGVTLAPGRVGANSLAIDLEPGGATPIDPLAVRIALSDPARGVEPIRLDAHRDGATWRAGPVVLPHAGDWVLVLDVLVSDFAQETLEATATIGE